MSRLDLPVSAEQAAFAALESIGLMQGGQILPLRQPKRPSLLVTGREEPVPFPTLEALMDRVAELLDGRRPVLAFTAATWLGYGTFPAFSVHAEAEAGENAGPRATTYVCTVAVQDRPRDQVEPALLAAQLRRARGEAA